MNLNMFSVFRKVHGGYLDRVTFTSGECFVLEMVSCPFRITKKYLI